LRWGPTTDVCVPPYLPPGISREDLQRLSTDPCWTSFLDPQDFLPLAHADSLPTTAAGATALSDPAQDSRPYQLPPPNTAGMGLLPDPPDRPAGTQDDGAWWSPGNRWSDLGGGGLLAWLWELVHTIWCWLFPWWC